jgi:hypothetical protein
MIERLLFASKFTLYNTKPVGREGAAILPVNAVLTF